MKPTLTVFTPTYNRRALLGRCYESLLAQTVRDFIWLIIDDGSQDGTGDLVSEWQSRNAGFEIRYAYKENGGLHTAYNLAIAQMDTELSVCIDSDDAMPPHAVQRILEVWQARGSDAYAGIIGLDYTREGVCIGDPLPDEESIRLADLTLGKYPIRNGDRKLVIRTELYRSFAPLPVFPGELYLNPQYLHMKIGLERPFLVLNECLCQVEYQADGMSRNLFRQYANSPNSFALLRLLDLSLPGASFGFRLKKSIHYCSSCILAGQKRYIRKSPCPWITALALPFGFLLSRVIRWKTKRTGGGQK